MIDSVSSGELINKSYRYPRLLCVFIDRIIEDQLRIQFFSLDDEDDTDELSSHDDLDFLEVAKESHVIRRYVTMSIQFL